MPKLEKNQKMLYSGSSTYELLCLQEIQDMRCFSSKNLVCHASENLRTIPNALARWLSDCLIAFWFFENSRYELDLKTNCSCILLPYKST